MIYEDSLDALSSLKGLQAWLLSCVTSVVPLYLVFQLILNVLQLNLLKLVLFFNQQNVQIF